tara:strand:+ start:11557 stop:12099 length:543 start_codon:yes stop_codon:yes gene_type:complete
MENYYLQTAFAISVTPQEAALLQECFAVDVCLSCDLAELPSDDMQAVKSYYASRSEAFRSIFPQKPEEEDPFAGFFDLWSDPGFFGFGATLSITHSPDGGRCFASISGDDADVSALASLIQKICKSALPYGFHWAEGCREDDGYASYGGGYYVVTETGILGNSARWHMEETLRTLHVGAS